MASFGFPVSLRSVGLRRSVAMLRCGNVPAGALAVNAASGRHMNASEAKKREQLGSAAFSGSAGLKGSELESPPSTGKAWPLT